MAWMLAVLLAFLWFAVMASGGVRRVQVMTAFHNILALTETSLGHRKLSFVQMLSAAQLPEIMQLDEHPQETSFESN